MHIFLSAILKFLIKKLKESLRIEKLKSLIENWTKPAKPDDMTCNYGKRLLLLDYWRRPNERATQVWPVHQDRQFFLRLVELRPGWCRYVLFRQPTTHWPTFEPWVWRPLPYLDIQDWEFTNQLSSAHLSVFLPPASKNWNFCVPYYSMCFDTIFLMVQLIVRWDILMKRYIVFSLFIGHDILCKILLLKTCYRKK